MKKTFQNLKKSIANKNVKTYLLFVAFTTFLWLALQFSKNYSQEVVFGIEYINVQKEKLLAPNTDKEITMVLEGNGFQLLKYSLLKKDIELDVSKASKSSEKKAFFTGKSMLNIIKNSLDYSGNIAYSLQDTLKIYYDVFEKKELPITISSEINYQPGFMSLKGMVSDIKKVTVIGPKSIIDTLKVIKTKLVSLNNVHNDYEGEIEIESYDSNLKLSFDLNSIPLKLKVNKLTEGEFNVPITVKNMPKGSKIQLFPKQVAVVFNVGLQDYKKLSVKDFKVVADFNSASNNDNLLLKLEKWPSNVFNARLSEKKVQFILIK